MQPKLQGPKLAIAGMQFLDVSNCGNGEAKASEVATEGEKAREKEM